MERLTYLGRRPQQSGDPWAAPARTFHRSIPGYSPSKLLPMPALAEATGVGSLLVKCETQRFGLPSFKILGACYAVAATVRRHLREHGERPDLTVDSIREALSHFDPGQAPSLVTATDGNHGRAVAHAARWLGLRAVIFAPTTVSQVARRAIASEGCRLQIVDGDYDDAVARARDHAHTTPGSLLIQDTSWPGYHDVPRLIVDGYATLFDELVDQCDTRRPLALVVPVGVGSLAMAALQFARSRDCATVLGVEPARAPSATTSLRAGALVSVPTTPTIMAGLNCGTISHDAWSWLRDGMTACIAVSDDEAATAVCDLAVAGIDAGPCGAATLAGLRVAAAERRMRDALGLGTNAIVVLLNTESRSANPLPDRLPRQEDGAHE